LFSGRLPHMKLKYYVDSHKGITGPVMLALLLIYGRTDNPAAWIYFAMHGGYGLFWVLKSSIFPDKRWDKDVSVWFGVFGTWGGLSLYWVGGWMLMYFDARPPAWYLGLSVFLYAAGLFFHFGADMQKHARLTSTPGLITDGFSASPGIPIISVSCSSIWASACWPCPGFRLRLSPSGCFPIGCREC
jgi:hypothetical protein